MASDTPPPSSTPSTSTPSNQAQPPISPKKKAKKKKIKTLIPTKLTVALGETQKKERESDPEVFETVSKAKPKTSSSTSKSSDESSSTSASSNSTESLTKSITNSTQSLPKLPPRPSKCIHDEAQDKIYEYKIDIGRTYSQSSGTLSYDSVFVADESKVNTCRATGVTAKPVDVKVQTSKITDLNAQQHLEQTTAFDGEKYHKLVYGNECPQYAAPTPDYLFGRREQQLTKEAIMEAVEEYFTIPRDDMDLTIRIQRHGPFPILDLKCTPNPRTNIISTLSTSDAASSSLSKYTSSSYSSTSILKAVSAVSLATARSIKSVMSQGFDYLVAMICRKS
uniref:Uncharacterized protein n=1 Tax=Panagrolaimus sp. ES5 TaxID=591445 RepID=A0AC34FN82_9BILA